MALKCSYNIWGNLLMKGSLIWKAQRYSSLVMLAYVIYITCFIFSNNSISFNNWSEFFLSPQLKISTSLVFLLVVLHAFIGLWTVGTDYLTKRTLGFLNQSLSKIANPIRSFYYALFSLIGLFYLFIIFFIIWT
jgi:succinate dehydrogenase / fumarate reductase membrane anchor subunit